MRSVRDLGRVRVATLAILAVAALGGCTPTGGTASPTSSENATGAASASPSASPTATPSPTPTAEAVASCADLPPLSWTGPLLEGDDLASYVDKSRGEGARFPLFLDYGGVLCVYTAGQEVGLIAATSPISDADRSRIEGELAAEGFTSGSTAGAATWVLSVVDGWSDAYGFADGRWWYTTNVDYLGTLLAAR